MTSSAGHRAPVLGSASGMMIRAHVRRYRVTGPPDTEIGRPRARSSVGMMRAKPPLRMAAPSAGPDAVSWSQVSPWVASAAASQPTSVRWYAKYRALMIAADLTAVERGRRLAAGPALAGAVRDDAPDRRGPPADWAVRQTLARTRARGRGLTCTLVVGSAGAVRDVLSELKRHPEAGYAAGGVCLTRGDHAALGVLADGLRTVSYPAIDDAIRAGRYSAVIVADGLTRDESRDPP